MEISLKSGGYDIVAHGEVFLFGADKDLTIDIVADRGFSFSIVLRFQEDPGGGQRVENQVSGDEIIVTCVNFRDFGTGLMEPVRIAEVEGGGLYLMFWSSVNGKERKTRCVQYTLFHDGEGGRGAG